MADNLFHGLPPPSAPPTRHSTEQRQSSFTVAPAASIESLPNSPPPVLKSALKRAKPPDPYPEVSAVVPEKRLRFKTTADASETQVIEAMQKIASHITNPSKFVKASKLAIQLIQAGSVNTGTSDCFFAILESAMSASTACNDALVRAHYHSLFSAAEDSVEYFDKKQRNQFTVWTIRAIVANDLYTDDSFVFSKAAGRIKEAISILPIATKDEDTEEAASLKDKTEVRNEEDSDPFGLDALIPTKPKRDGKKDASTKICEEEDKETKRFLKSQREAWIHCLEIAARRYKTPWCQTCIDILVKHTFDNISRFTSEQRDAIEKLWSSIREQQIRRKNGKSVSGGKLDANDFECLQQKYANEKISIRHSVSGSGGDRRAEQWLG